MASCRKYNRLCSALKNAVNIHIAWVGTVIFQKSANVQLLVITFWFEGLWRETALDDVSELYLDVTFQSTSSVPTSTHITFMALYISFLCYTSCWIHAAFQSQWTGHHLLPTQSGHSTWWSLSNGLWTPPCPACISTFLKRASPVKNVCVTFSSHHIKK